MENGEKIYRTLAIKVIGPVQICLQCGGFFFLVFLVYPLSINGLSVTDDGGSRIYENQCTSVAQQVKT